MGIGNHEIQTNKSLRVISFYNSNVELKVLFEKHVLETGFQFRVLYSNKILWEIKYVVEQFKWQAQVTRDKDGDF